MPRFRPGYIIALLLFIFAVAGCGGSAMENVDIGSQFTFRQGYPELRTFTSGYISDEGATFIRINADVVHGSLIYRKTPEDDFKAGIATDITIYQTADKELQTIQTQRFNFEIREQDPGIANEQSTFSFERSIALPPGLYIVEVRVTDTDSRKTTSRRTNAFVPDPAIRVPDLTQVQLLGVYIADEPYERNITTFDVTGAVDSLKFAFQVLKPDASEPLTVRMELLSFRYDDDLPRTLSMLPLTRGSMSYRGIDYSRYEIVDTQLRRLEAEDSGTIMIEYQLPRPETGNYRFRVSLDKQEDDAGSDAHFRARDFSIKSRNYPAVRSASELAKPLYFLMNRREFDQLMAINDPDSLKSEIDKFWLGNIGNRNKARSVIELYYSRVEEANKQFSNFKEGWMTDMGMVYVLFGPPWYVEQSLEYMAWHYSYNQFDARTTFIFERPRIFGDDYPFNHFILVRQRDYQNLEYERVRDWLTGDILSRN
ncbi:MAG: GWxTD domain-containing protein [Rhodothermaceae bacterium]|nr:GWxTD domain-containing protein [Rhodothermaceae bacterium]